MNSLPDFIIIGAQRCGTTSVYNYIITHPKIATVSTKELHFFDVNFSKGLDWYKSQFSHDKVIGEASPYYIFHPHCPKRIFKAIPTVKIIAILRNPIDRAYSHYWHEVRVGKEDLTFEKAIDSENARLEGEVEKMMKDEAYYSLSHQHFSYLTRGRYIEQIKEWYNLFEKKQILVLSSEEFFLNPMKSLNLVYDFLDLPCHKLEKFKIFNKGNTPQMENKTRSFLSEYFKEHNQKLFEYLGKHFDWK